MKLQRSQDIAYALVLRNGQPGAGDAHVLIWGLRFKAGEIVLDLETVRAEKIFVGGGGGL